MSAPAFDRHFWQLTGQYGKLVIINLLGSNLVGSKEGEATLSTAYQSQQNRSAYRDTPHVLWDFHAEGGAKNLDKLDSVVCKLVDRLSYFSSSGLGGGGGLQSGVVRTNCTDCLDRTNAVQMWLGRLGEYLSIVMDYSFRIENFVQAVGKHGPGREGLYCVQV